MNFHHRRRTGRLKVSAFRRQQYAQEAAVKPLPNLEAQKVLTGRVPVSAAGPASASFADFVSSLPAEGRSIALRYRLDPLARQKFLAVTSCCELYPHQRSGAEFIVRRMCGELEPTDVRGGGQLDDMRMGKCRCVAFAVLLAIQRRVAAGGERFGEPILIFAPKDLLDTWRVEIEAVVGRDTLSVTVLETDALQRQYPGNELSGWLLGKLRDETDIVLAAHSLVTTSTHFAAALLKEQLTFSAIFCDEAHEYIMPNTKSNTTISALSARSKWYVSGTPIQNSLRSVQNALLFMGVSPALLATLDSDEALVRLARQVSIRRTLNPICIIPVNVLDFSCPHERALYDSIKAQLVSTIVAQQQQQQQKQSTIGPLRLIHMLRKFCISPYMCQRLFEIGTFQLPANMLLAPARFVGNEEEEQQQQHEQEEETGDPMDISSSSSCIEGPSPMAALTNPNQDSYDSLVMCLLLREMTLEAIGASIEFAHKDMDLADQPLVLAHLRAKGRLLRPQILPLVNPKERWVCQTLLSADTDRTREKVVIFSHSRVALQRLARLLDLRLSAGVPGARSYGYIDGLLDLEDRRQMRARFDSDPNLGVLLAMIKVNSRGLDMTCANHAVLYDPWWNPNPEHQAISRIKGFKQKRPVHVYRLAMAGTIETLITAEADRKVQLDQYALPQTTVQQQQQPDVPFDVSPIGALERDDDHDSILRIMESLTAYH